MRRSRQICAFPAAPRPRQTAIPWRDSNRDMHREERAPARATTNSWIAVEVGGGVTTLQSDLVRPQLSKLHEELVIELNSTLRTNVQFHHPTADALGIELFVPSPVQRIGEEHAFSIAAEFNHLRSAIERLIWI